MAVKARDADAEKTMSKASAMTSRSRRVYFGTNVAAMILAALLLLVFVNWIGQRRNFRRDLAGMGRYGLSDRTKKIIDGGPETIRLAAIYASQEPEKRRGVHRQ